MAIEFEFSVRFFECTLVYLCALDAVSIVELKWGLFNVRRGSFIRCVTEVSGFSSYLSL